MRTTITTYEEFVARYAETRTLFEWYISRAHPSRRRQVLAAAIIKGYDPEDIYAGAMLNLMVRLKNGPLNCAFSTAVVKAIWFHTGRIIRHAIRRKRPYVMTDPMNGTKLVPSILAAVSPPDQYADQRYILYKYLPRLSVNHRTILTRRFGLYDTDAETLQVIGDSMGITKERVRQHVEAAIVRIILMYHRDLKLIQQAA